MKKVVVAIDSFKGCMSSLEAGEAAAEGVRKAVPTCEVVCLPVADGGEGMLEVLVAATGGEYVTAEVCDPLMRPIRSRYGISGDGRTALIEMAAASGLPLLSPEERNPMIATSYGTGQLIRDALERGCRDILVGIGGSATNDAGCGMLQALGFRFLDRSGNVLEAGGEMLGKVAAIDRSQVLPALAEARFTVACDVNNPFSGENGAAYVFARQKGADDEMIRRLDAGMRAFEQVVMRTTGCDIGSIPGAGAAGGMGGGFVAFLGARLLPGVEVMLQALDFRRRIGGADLIITGEGRVDRQTAMGKVPSGILKEARAQHIPVIAVAGSIADGEEVDRSGFDGVFSIAPGPVSLEQAMDPAFAKANLRRLATQLCRLIQSLNPTDL